MNLPAEFISIITNTFGEEGEQLIANLPALIEEVSTRWGLTEVQPVSNLSYNFVAFAQRTSPLPQFPLGDGNVVIKIGVPRDELMSEIAALRLFDGEGACQLIDADEERGFLLLERLRPGVMLSTMQDDEEATHLAAEVMKKIWRPLDFASLPVENQKHTLSGTRASELQKFIRLTDWFDGLKGLRQMFNGGTGPFNESIVDRVERSVAGFFAENQQPVLMHGDFHHYNILSSERGWLVIDPKGVIGPACYEVGPLLINPWGELIDRTDIQQITKRRIDILHEHLGFERERIHAWGLAHAILSAWWSMESNTGWEYAAAFAEMIADLHMK
jgi:streptomycin 6-kinase